MTKHKKRQKREKRIIGRRDKVDFPDLGLYEIDAKIDTGAYTSSIHCHNIRVMRKGGKEIVAFNLLDPSHPSYNEKELQLQLYSKRKVRNSFGRVEERYIVNTKIKLFGESYDIELSLADRSRMQSPVLLGRKLLNRRFVVDVTKVNLSYKLKSREGG